MQGTATQEATVVIITGCIFLGASADFGGIWKKTKTKEPCGSKVFNLVKTFISLHEKKKGAMLFFFKPRAAIVIKASFIRVSLSYYRPFRSHFTSLIMNVLVGLWYPGISLIFFLSSTEWILGGFSAKDEQCPIVQDVNSFNIFPPEGSAF